MSILGRIISKISFSGTQSAIPSERELIRKEARIGGQLFGNVPKGRRRDFFCLDNHTWIWYEQWTDPMTKKVSSLTTRYEVRGDKIIKMQDGQPYKFVSMQEAKDLLAAAKLYYSRISNEIYASPAQA